MLSTLMGGFNERCAPSEYYVGLINSIHTTIILYIVYRKLCILIKYKILIYIMLSGLIIDTMVKAWIVQHVEIDPILFTNRNDEHLITELDDRELEST